MYPEMVNSAAKCEKQYLNKGIGNPYKKRSARMSTSVREKYCSANTLGSAKWSKSLKNEGYRELKRTCPLFFQQENCPFGKETRHISFGV